MATPPDPAVPRQRAGVLERVWTDFSVSRFYAFGLISTIAAATAFQPLSLIKVQQQALSASGQSLSLRAVFRRVVSKEGYRGLYRGLGTVLVGTIATDMLYCTAFELLLLKSSRGFEDTENSHAFSGLFAEFASNGVVVPFEVISQRMMIQSGNNGTAAGTAAGAAIGAPAARYTSGLDAARQLIARGGVAELYRGYFITAATFGFESAVWWYAYALLRRNLYELQFGSINGARGRDSPLAHFGAGLGAGVVTALVANPLDVLKTRTQLASTSLAPSLQSPAALGLLMRSIAADGWRVLFRGTTAKVLYMAPMGAITSWLYELVKSMALADRSED